MYKIDAHNHPDYHGRTPEGILANMDKVGIQKTCLLSWECPMDEVIPASYQYFAYTMDQTMPVPFRRCWDGYVLNPDRFILGYAPDPRRPGAVDKMKNAVNTYRVQMCGEIKLRMMYDNPDAVELFRFCGEQGLPVTLHFDYYSAQYVGPGHYPRERYWYGGDIDVFERLLKLCPETNFLGHAPGFWCHISNDDLGLTTPYPTGPVIPGGKIEQLLDKYENLYLDCSAGSCMRALSRDPEYTKKLMLAHPDRFVYARDAFDVDVSEVVDPLGLPQENLEQFYHGNIERLIPAMKISD